VDLTQPAASPLQLAQALRLDGPVRLALTGSGGKTTALFSLARQLPGPVLACASTHLALNQLALADVHTVVRTAADIPTAGADLRDGVLLFTGPAGAGERVAGLDEPALQALLALAQERGLPLLVEADGSRGLPLKAPAAHEPPVPAFAEMVVVVAGLAGVGQPLDEGSVHRPEIYAALAGAAPGTPLTPALAARVLAHPQGGLKNIPSGARRVVLLNQASSPERVHYARQMAHLLLPAFDAVVIANLACPGEAQAETEVLSVHETTAGIVLAAGQASRFGQPKQLLRWQDESLVRRAARLALEAGLAPVIVVTGAHEPEVRAALAGLPVTLADNPAWAEGQSTSLRAGLRALPLQTGAAVFLLADQPALSIDLLRGLVNRHAETFVSVVAPQVAGRRTNPVLFDRRTFPVLMNLSGDVGGRALFSDPQAYPVAWLPWDDASLLDDIDTPEDYERIKNRGEI
jgi:molybdenum cofactor cytidylyltransferase